MDRWLVLAAQFAAQLAIIAYLACSLRNDVVRRRLGIAASLLVCAGLMVRAGVGYLEVKRYPEHSPNRWSMPMRAHVQYRCEIVISVCEAMAWCLLLAGIYRSYQSPRDSVIRASTSAAAPAAMDSA